MLAVARALMGNPSLLLMDEPTEGLAPLMVRQVEDVLRRLKEKGLSILLVEQNLAFAEGLADFVYIMNKGEIVCGLPPGDFKTNKELKRLYLGV
jgi:branched-chain amino acid transport system ATP-binding protein